MSEAQVSVNQFYSNADATFTESGQKEPSILLSVLDGLNDEDVLNFFEFSATVDWILKNNYVRVALQFPDSFICYSEKIATALEKRCTSIKTFVLADTSYRSCCVDEIAAAHANCDALVHYGDACLSKPSDTLPVRFVLGCLPIDNSKFMDSLSSYEKHFVDRPVLFLTDAPYGYSIDSLSSLLKERYPNVSFYSATVPSCSDADRATENQVESLGRRVPREFTELEDVLLLFIGSTSSPFLPIWLMTHPQCSAVLSYEPNTSKTQYEQTQSSRQLRKRLFLVEKLKDANTVGLVVGSVGVDGHREAVQRMRLLCKSAGKKLYVISVGKINVAKLSNFTSDIDIFVLLSCPFGVLLDCSDYFRPVLSMFEAEAALNPASSWLAGKGWTADFSRFLHDSIGTEDGDCADMSLVSGRVRAKIDRKDENGVESGQVALYTAGDYFKERSWRGLDDGCRLDESTTVEDGRAGIAAGYRNEPDKK